jgi:NADH dehydrogenase (ubiquinone) Fe-S protein 4
MGWGSTGDVLSNIELDFCSQEDAELYCQRMGFKYRVDEPHFLKKRIKSYSANFSWDKKTRRTAK